MKFPRWFALAAMAVSACASEPSTTVRDTGGAAPGAPARESRALVIAVRTEGDTIAAKALSNPGTNIIPAEPFNAGLAFKDTRDVPHPYLVEALPQLNTESWRVFPDGRMETTYRLKPNLVWHDGAPLSAQDFALAWRVYSTPELGVTAGSPPLSEMAEVVAGDDRSVVIRWRRPYPEAGSLVMTDFQALPGHILERPFREMQYPEAFASHPFWTIEYVGLGPYRLDRWERGVFLEAVAFDGYVRGRPRVERIKVVPIPDPNTVLANLLAGEVHIAVSNAMPFQHGWVLKGQWDVRGGGTVLINLGGARRSENQVHPDRANPRAILDVRVRRAIAYATDRQAINDSIFEGQGVMADTLLSPDVDYFPAVDRALAKYAYDLRRAEQLMNEAGYFKDSGGFYAGGDGRLAPEIRVLSGPQNEAVMSIMADGWRRAGFDFREFVFPVAQVADREARAHFPFMFSTDGGSLDGMSTAGIPTPQNRWTGSNRGSWSNPEYDRLVDAWNTTLDRNERNQRMVEMAKLYSEELPSTPIFFHLTVTPHGNTLRGPTNGVDEIHTWEFR